VREHVAAGAARRAALAARPDEDYGAPEHGAEARATLLANFDLGLVHAREELAYRERILADAEERDRLQAERPPGCTCLGLGGSGVMIELPSGQRIWSKPCEACPEGHAEIEGEGPSWGGTVGVPFGLDDLPPTTLEHAPLTEARLPQLAAPRTWGDFAEAAKAPAVKALWPFRDGPPPARVGVGKDGRVEVRPERTLRGALLFGPFGTGKTTLAALALRAWVEAGGRGLFTTLADYLELLRPADERRLVVDSYQPERALLTGLLVVDDLGAETLSAWGRERLFTLVNVRLDAGRPTLWTSNYKPGEIVGRFIERGGDKREGQRIMERIVACCDTVEVGGRDYRDVG
jgi:hypothetical protein